MGTEDSARPWAELPVFVLGPTSAQTDAPRGARRLCLSEGKCELSSERRGFKSPRSLGAPQCLGSVEEGGGNRVHAAYGDKFDRLVKLKDRYDPHNFFRMNQNIRRATENGACERGDG